MSTQIVRLNNNEPIPAFMALIADQLELVENRMAKESVSNATAASEISFHLFKAGGKRIRPALVVLSALACNGAINDPGIIDIAVIAEFVHTASLVHDDVVDETNERRGVSTANEIWGNKLSVLAGDYLLAKAFSILSRIESRQIMEVLSSAAVEMTESEVLQASSDGSVEEWKRNYWQIIRGKTAVFMSSCCECGGIVAGADEAQRMALADYGLNVGLAFQITDDLLDIAGDSVKTGKDMGNDLMNGKFTLPVLLALEKSQDNPGILNTDILDSGYLSFKDASVVAQAVVDLNGVEMARKVAEDYVNRACASLDVLADSKYAGALRELAESIIRRDS